MWLTLSLSVGCIFSSFHNTMKFLRGSGLWMFYTYKSWRKSITTIDVGVPFRYSTWYRIYGTFVFGFNNYLLVPSHLGWMSPCSLPWTTWTATHQRNHHQAGAAVSVPVVFSERWKERSLSLRDSRAFRSLQTTVETGGRAIVNLSHNQLLMICFSRTRYLDIWI